MIDIEDIELVDSYECTNKIRYKDVYYLVDKNKNKILLKSKVDFDLLKSKYILFENKDKTIITDVQGNILSKHKGYRLEYEELNDSFIFRKNDKQGVMSVKGKILINPKYDKIYYIPEIRGYIVKQKDKLGIIDEFENLIIPIEYKGFHSPKWNLLCAKKDNKWGVINYKNETVISFEYDELLSVSVGDKFKAKKDDKYGVIDLNNNVIVPFEYDDLWNQGSMIIGISADGSRNLIISNGDIIYNNLSSLLHVSNGNIKTNYYIVSLVGKGKYGIIDEKGKTLIDFKYNEMKGRYSKKRKQFYFLVKNSFNLYGVVDINDNVIIPFSYAFLSTSDIDSDILVRAVLDFDIFKLSNKYFIDLNNNVLNKPIVEDCNYLYKFSEYSNEELSEVKEITV